MFDIQYRREQRVCLFIFSRLFVIIFLEIHLKGNPTQLAHDVRTTFLRRRFHIQTSFQRPCNVVLTSCGKTHMPYPAPSK